jgi:hypothetical protein
VSERTRYGDLTRDAARHLTAAALHLTDGPFPSLPAASAAVTAYADLHDALYRLGWQLRGGPISAAAVVAPERRQPREDAVLGLLDQLGRSATRDYAARTSRAHVAGHWRRAALDLRAATDLLATHHSPLGQARTPNSPDLTDPAVADPAWREYAGLARATAAIGEQLAVTARGAGVTAPRVRGLPWASERITNAAQRLGRVIDAGDAPSVLAELEVANPAVRVDDPLLELADRLGRLHTAAWIHTSHDTMTVPTLSDLAAAGVLVHAAAHRVLTADPVGDTAALNSIAANGTAWRQVHVGLTSLRSIDPVPGGFSRELHVLRRLLPQAEADPRAEQARGVLADACRSHQRVAEWSSTALAHLATSGRVYVSGRALTGDDVGDDPQRAAAKLADRLTAVPDRFVDNILANYATAALASVDNAAAHTEHPRTRASIVAIERVS